MICLGSQVPVKVGRGWCLKSARQLHYEYTGAIKALFMLLAGLHFIWELMLLMTILYHHTFAHKVRAQLTLSKTSYS